MPKRALILVDIQNDFMPGGALAVPEGDRVVPLANRLIAAFDLVVATQDWHPADHGSFATQHEGHSEGDVVDLDGLDQILWPDHCVQGTAGAEFVKDLEIDAVDRVFRKGTDRTIDSYSGFFDNGHRKATGMGHFLAEADVDEVVVCGVATDYCVKFTVLDALDLGFGVTLARDACRGVNNQEGDADRAIDAMREAGAIISTTDELLS
jgi:nicotinamidase/pyrazinamidase